MARPLHEIVSQLLENVASTPEGRETLRRYDHTLNFDVLDGEAFHAEFRQGEWVVSQGAAPPRPVADAHEIKAKEDAFRDWFEGRVRLSDAIHDNRMFPTAAHTTKRHIDNWLAKLVRLGLGRPGLKDEY